MADLFNADFETGSIASIFDLNAPGSCVIVTAGSGGNPAVRSGGTGTKLLFYDPTQGSAPRDAIASFSSTSSTVYVSWWYWFPQTVISDFVGDHPWRLQRGSPAFENCDWGMSARSSGAGPVTFSMDIYDGPDNSDHQYEDESHHGFVSLPVEQWTHFEALFIKNVGNTSANGTLKVAVDGVEVYSSTAVRYTYASASWTGWNSFRLVSNMDGGGSGTHWWIDDARVTDQASDYLSGGGADVTPPVVTITSPTSSPTFSQQASPITVGGTASDDTAVTSVTWVNNRGGSGAASTSDAYANWTFNATLAAGVNVITVTASDAAANTSTDVITVTCVFPINNVRMVMSLP